MPNRQGDGGRPGTDRPGSELRHAAAQDDARRVTLVPGGPMLIEGPVDVVLPDGTSVRSERPVVAICTCRRSRHFPFCDTSHRERSRPDVQAESGSGARRDD